MSKTRFIKNVDWVFMGLLGIIMLVSLVVLKSASANISSDPYYFVKKQIVWIFLGLILMVLVATFDYKFFMRFSNYIYGLNILFLLAVFVFGHESKGAKRWIDLGFFEFQPAELSKIIIIICFAVFLAKRQDELEGFWDVLPGLVYVGLPMLLILKQPDLGTSLIFLAIMLGMLWVGGTRPKLMLIILLVILVLIFLVFILLYFATDGFQNPPGDLPIPLPLKPYQLLRLVIFINPDMDPLDSGYHMIQSKVAIGSGGIWGKGYQHGSQVQGNFLPEHHTDFIFSTVGEELGFLGGGLILALYFLLFWRMMKIAREARDILGSLIVVGVISMLAFQFMINVGMTMGIMPVTGIPLPFLTYGGSGMLSNLIAMGFVLSVNLHKEKLLF